MQYDLSVLLVWFKNAEIEDGKALTDVRALPDSTRLGVKVNGFSQGIGGFGNFSITLYNTFASHLGTGKY